LDDDSDSRFWGALSKLFRQKSISIEELILEANRNGTLIQEDASMLLNILRLEKKQVADIMVPRPDILCAEADDGIPAICELVRLHGHSRIPIYEGNRDNILGIVYAKDLLAPLLDKTAPLPDPRTLMRTPLLFPKRSTSRKCSWNFAARKSTWPSPWTNTGAPRDWSPWRMSWKRSWAKSKTSTIRASRRRFGNCSRASTSFPAAIPSRSCAIPWACPWNPTRWKPSAAF